MTINRRQLGTAALATASAFTAATAPASALIERHADQHPDALLLEAGRIFDGMERKFHIANHAWKPNDDAFWKALKEIRKSKPGSLNADDAGAVYALASKLADEREPPPDVPTCDDITNVLDQVQRYIMAFPARTLPGYAVKARVLRFAHPDLWRDDPADLDWDKQMLRGMIESLLQAAGPGAA